jgi:hypothetical protein
MAHACDVLGKTAVVAADQSLVFQRRVINDLKSNSWGILFDDAFQDKHLLVFLTAT